MFNRIITGVGFFCLLFVPLLALSFWAYTVFHQMTLLVGAIVCAWAAYYVTNLMRDRDRLGREVFLQAYELKKSKEALESCLATDTQTQFYNTRLLDSRLTEECDRARRYQRPLSFLLVSIDSLSDLARTYGANLPQLIVQDVASFLKESTRSVDIIVRRGEDQFVVLLPETQLDQARIVAERIRYAVANNTFRVEGTAIKVTVSVGFMSFDVAIHRGKADVSAALEQALSSAKKRGPNQIATLAGETS
ncbi:MAG: hypothetical protein A3G87_07455 [Omnitrophica bacterium RIFCSPLOWO2_12_FULL_50_11]|nr:MAG: hypothetical protein A3G87_07455 [Omnitrophica bacterium RIFCSPLOWO2_12_FULL_50_11]